MRVRNIECQLAQGQIRRYLSGDQLSDTAIEQLESHVDECNDCSEFFQAMKASLLDEESAANDLEEANAPAQSSASSEVAAVPRFLVDAIRQKRATLDKIVRPIATHAVIEDVREEKSNPKIYTKPLLYSIGLAAVLIGMSTIMRDPTRLFGDRAETTILSGASQTANPKISGTTSGVAATTQIPKGPANGTEIVALAPPKNPSPSSTTSTNPNTNVKPIAANESVDRSNVATKPEPPTNMPVRTTATSARATSNTRPLRRPSRTKARPRNTQATSPKPQTKPNGGIKVYDDSGSQISNR